jgi:hypothetical protein
VQIQNSTVTAWIRRSSSRRRHDHHQRQKLATQLRTHNRYEGCRLIRTKPRKTIQFFLNGAVDIIDDVIIHINRSTEYYNTELLIKRLFPVHCHQLCTLPASERGTIATTSCRACVVLIGIVSTTGLIG